MRSSLPPTASEVNGHPSIEWPYTDAESLNAEARAAADELLGHDAERLARLCSPTISRRQVNRQREYMHEEGEFGSQWAHRLADILRQAFRIGGAARTARLCRLLALAGGHALSSPVSHAAASGDAKAVLSVIGEALADSSATCAAAAREAADGRGLDAKEARALLPRIAEAIASLQTLQETCQQIAHPRHKPAPVAPKLAAVVTEPKRRA